MRCDACGFELSPNAKFCAECGEPVAWREPPAGGRSMPPDSGAGSSDGERRQLTVVFCDLVGSTAIASRLDPEDWREVVRAYQGACARVVERFGGYVAQYLGDGLVVYFGFPTAHEDDALRAVRAGLGIIDALAELEPDLARLDVKLAVRIGVHTGTVVVGEVGSSARRETLALGDTTNLAARLQEVAEPNTVVLSDATFRLVRSHFVTEERGVHALKGITRPVAVYRAARGVRVRSTTNDGATSLVLLGRDRELSALTEAWDGVRKGAGHVVAISGDAGIGKSRLAFALRGAIAEQPHTWLECRASSDTIDTALYPIVTLQEDGLGLSTFAKPEQRTAQLERALDRVGMAPKDYLPLFAGLHGLPLPSRYALPTFTPEALRRRTLDALVEWFLRLSDAQPLVVLVEDVQFIDPTTLELVGRLREKAANHRVLLVLTHRPGFELPPGTGAPVSTVALARLSKEDATKLVLAFKAARSLPAEVVSEIVARSDGVPLYVEELTRAVADSEERGDGDRRPVVPSSLQDSLMSRLDQLGRVKDLAQLCATLGREFSLALVASVSPLPEGELEAALDRLVSAAIFLRRGAPPVYSFKHGLVREQAYESLLKTTRQTYHKRVAEAIAAKFPNVAQNQPELVAHHYQAAQAFDLALPYWLSAGQKSIAASANVEASRQLGYGLDALGRLPASPDRDGQELLLLTMRGVALIASKGYAAEEVANAFARARALCHKLGDTPHLYPVLFGLFLYYLVRSDGKSSRELAAQLLTIAEKQGDAEYVLEAHSGNGALAFWEGKFAECHEHLLRARVLYDASKHAHHQFVYGQDPLAYGYSYGALALWFLGYPDQAIKSAEKALELAQRTNHPLTLAGVLSFAGDLHHHLGNRQLFADFAEKTLAVAVEQGLPMWVGNALTMRGWANFDRANPDVALGEIQAGLDAFHATGAELNTMFLSTRLVEANLAAGRYEDGIARAEELLRLLETHFESYYEAELVRLKGELHWRSGKGPSDAEACFRRALAVAKEQGAKSLELRAAMSLGKLEYGRGNVAEALRLLSEVYGWFTEGLDTPDLVQAKRLLEEWQPAAR